MRYKVVMLLLCWVGSATAAWRESVSELVVAGRYADAVSLAEHARVSWLAPHLARQVPKPAHYIGWVAGPDTVFAYGLGPDPWVRTVARTADIEAAVAQLRAAVEAGGEPPPMLLDDLREMVLAPLADVLPDGGPWVFATDGALSSLPFGMLTDTIVIRALSERSAALSALRAGAARRRPPSLFAYARSGTDDPDALPAAHAEIQLAATSLGGSATLLSGQEAFRHLQRAVYDGTLTAARFVLVAAHTVHRDGVIALALDDADGGLFAPSDTVHLQITAELVVLSACETGDGAGFAEAGARAGAGMLLLTAWRVDDAASAQFVAAIFDELGRGAHVVEALSTVRRAFARGDHGDAYRHPYFWSGWQLWGGL